MRAFAAFTSLALLSITAGLPAQTRVVLGGVPSNLLLDLSATVTAPDAAAADAFFALMPVSNGGSSSFDFAVFDGDASMNVSFGSGNWLRCTMVATQWAYLSNDACAHQPPLGTAAPLSLLTSNYDYGTYFGMPGAPHTPWPNATLFGGTYLSFCQGLPSWSQERWQLRTRGWGANEAWNACPPNQTVTPNFGGWLVARFTFSFQ